MCAEGGRAGRGRGEVESLQKKLWRRRIYLKKIEEEGYIRSFALILKSGTLKSFVEKKGRVVGGWGQEGWHLF